MYNITYCMRIILILIEVMSGLSLIYYYPYNNDFRGNLSGTMSFHKILFVIALTKIYCNNGALNLTLK